LAATTLGLALSVTFGRSLAASFTPARDARLGLAALRHASLDLVAILATLPTRSARCVALVTGSLGRPRILGRSTLAPLVALELARARKPLLAFARLTPVGSLS
jgi:hypothetical protein